MAEKVRGLTVEITADAKKFKSEMSNLRKEAKTSQTELNALQKKLELNFDSETFKKAQQVAQRALDETSNCVDTLRNRLKYLQENNSADTSEYKRLQSELAQAELNAQRLENQLKKINDLKFTSLGKSVEDVGNKISKAGQVASVFSAGAVASITGLGALANQATKTGAEIDDLSLRFGVSAQKIQEWQYLAVQTGVDVEVFNKALIKARSAMLDLSSGNMNNQAKAIEQLGLNMSQFGSNEEMFDGVIDALSKMEDKTLQASIANEIFGDKIAYQLLPFLNAGEEALSQFKDEFSSMSSLSNEQVSALAGLDDILFRIKEQFRYIGLQIGASFMPLIKSLAEYIETKVVPKFEQLSNWFNSLSLSQQKFALGALAIVSALGPVLLMIGKLTTAVGSFIKIIPQIGAQLSTLAANPIVLIIAVVAGLLALLYTRSEEFRESIHQLVSTLGEILKPILDTIMTALSQLMEVITPIVDLFGNLLAEAINLVITALSPLIDTFQFLMNLLQPLISVALIPLKLALTALSVPLQLIGTLIQYLNPLFKIFGMIVEGVMKTALAVINLVLGAIEDAINWCIGVINKLIDGVNDSLGWLGVHIDRLKDVSLRIKTEEGQQEVSSQIKGEDNNNDFIYDNVDTSSSIGDTYNYDYSSSNTTQNVTVTIQNYASEVDVDDLVHQINVKLAEAM